jgi:hypothetical protein
MFTLEIKGTALVVTNATESEATDLFESEEFKEDLRTLKTEGRPLWDGSSPLVIRPASEDEVDAFDEALDDDEFEEEDEDETEDDDEPIDVVFLVEVDDMAEDGGVAAS